MRAAASIVFLGLMAVTGLLLGVDAGGNGRFFFESPLGILYLYVAAVTFIVELVLAVHRAIEAAAERRASSKPET